MVNVVAPPTTVEGGETIVVVLDVGEICALDFGHGYGFGWGAGIPSME